MTGCVAAIDAGTNTFRLLIADRIGGVQKPLCKLQRITRLGGDYRQDCGLAEQSMRRAEETLKEFSRLIDHYSPDRVRAVTTSIVREAQNGCRFVEIVRRKTGIELEVISGDREAWLTVQGVLPVVAKPGIPLLVFDIGGGSTEFSLVDNQGSVFLSRSYPFGVVKLTEKYIDPEEHSPNARQQMGAEIDEYLDDLIGDLQLSGRFPLPAEVVLVGTAGTMTTFAAMDQQLEVYDSTMINGCSINFSRLEFFHHRLWEMEPGQRRQVRGLEPGREDVILAGGEVALRIMKRLNFEQVTVSDDGLLEGVARSLLAEGV